MRLYKHQNGNYYVEFARGKHRSLRTKNVKDARQIYNALKRESLNSRLNHLDKNNSPLLGDFIETFLNSHTEISDTTHSNYLNALNQLTNSIGGNIPLNAVPDKMDKFKNDCLARNVAPESVNAYLRCINVALTVAYDRGYIKKEPKIKKLKTNKKLPRILTMNEIVRLLRFSRQNDFEMYRIIVFALWTGARRMEIKNARYEDIINGSIRITGKGGKDRFVPLLPMASHVVGISDRGWIFIQRRLQWYTERFHRICTQCTIENSHFHNLRHTSATLMLSKGVSLTSIQAILGHSSIVTTQIYAKVVQDTIRDEMMRMVK